MRLKIVRMQHVIRKRGIAQWDDRGRKKKRAAKPRAGTIVL
jgi:hypothetical protein